MGCPHEVWERSSAVEGDGLCPLCLQSMLALSERRLATSEEARTGLVAMIERLRGALRQIAEHEARYPDRLEDAAQWFQDIAINTLNDGCWPL